jgi:hypothetical protein
MARFLLKHFAASPIEQAERFSQVVRNGLLTGETTQSIAKRLIGNLERSEERLFGEAANDHQYVQLVLKALLRLAVS